MLQDAVLQAMGSLHFIRSLYEEWCEKRQEAYSGTFFILVVVLGF
jgi:hypothetical protein